MDPLILTVECDDNETGSVLIKVCYNFNGQNNLKDCLM